MESTLLKNKIEAASALENEHLLQNILSKVPAIDFASAACVSKAWNRVCNRILSRPKLATALSLDSYLDVAVEEVMNKVLSEPIRPQFAIAFVGLNYNLADTHQLITRKLGSKIPIITNSVDGMIGRDARTNVIREAKWDLLQEDVPDNFGGLCNLLSQINYCGIVLVVGWLPGLKVETIPLLRSEMDDRSFQSPKAEMIDNFLMDINHYTTTVSDCTSPDAIIMIGDRSVDLKPVLVQMDNNMSKETVIVGDASGNFLFERGDNSRNHPEDLYYVDAVALVFAKENASNVGGKIRFSVTLSNGLVPFGPQLTVAGAVIAAEENSTRLTARMAGHHENFNIRALCKQIRAKIQDKNLSFYIGVTHRNECSIGSQQSYLAYYEVLREGGFSIVVDGVGIKPGDSFVFYHTDSEMAFSSIINAYDDLRILKTPATSTSHSGTINSVRNKNEIFGGLIFSCCSRSELLRVFRTAESLPFSTNYPGIPVAGMFGTGEVARVSKRLISLDDRSNSGGCFVHHYSTVYLVMSYNPLH